ncbi:MAG: hypothetical protein HY270_06710 [Deltaproteobacteria bacterium]|nr:hypothetical protein [Deltaproteobacteria bacterium]
MPSLRIKVTRIAVALVLVSTPALGELGWKEADYAKHYGSPQKSPLTPDQVRFDRPGGGMLLLRMADGRSQEELWVVERDEKAIPEALRKQAREATKSKKPARVVRFKVPLAPAAEIYETTKGRQTIQVDVRNRGFRSVALCLKSKPCILLDQILNIERQTDALIAPGAIEMMRRRD